jgi:glucose-6-phosphate isomerase
VWRTLSDHKQTIASQHMRDWFATDRDRFSRFSLQVGDLFLDYSRNRITDQTLQLFCELAKQHHLAQQIEALFNGSKVNTTEDRPALHPQLRANNATTLQERARLYEFVDQVRLRASKIRHIVNVGIGGSYLGPLMTTQALKEFASNDLRFYFISCVDKAHLEEVLEQIDPATTLFIISSKSFTTFETMLNAKILLSWMEEKLGKDKVAEHFVAITAATDKARALGIKADYIFPVWEGVGGRYSIWSAIGLPLMLMIGTQRFDEFLAGAHAMDEHFRHADFANNMPVLMALLGIWYTNFFDAKAHVIAPYSQRLRYLIPYLQQADMESNGKSVNHQEAQVACQTSPVIFGEAGCNAQHTYHQLLHQGTQLIPVDFILVKNSDNTQQDDVLFASGVSQAQALMQGQTYSEAYRELPGNRPSNILLLNQLNPRSLGALIALYEHKIFVQGVIWNVNSFDQWGVELGKQLMPTILNQLAANHSDDPALLGLIKQYKG